MREIQWKCNTCDGPTLTMFIHEWISVKDRLPPEDVWIIGGNIKRVEPGVWLGQKKGFVIPQCYYLSLEISHWMPFPGTPK